MFIQGGGTGAFAAIALNLMKRTGTADYCVTGNIFELEPNGISINFLLYQELGRPKQPRREKNTEK